MENQTTTVAVPVTNAAPVKAAVICLVLAWVFALLPIPFISMMGMVVMNIAAFILAIICMSRSAVKPGVGVLAGSLVGTPIMYFVGLGLMSVGVANALIDHSNAAAQVQRSSPQAQINNSASANASIGASELAGKWKGHFVYPNGAKADFTMTLANPNGSLINGDMSEVDPNTKQSVSSVISGNFGNVPNTLAFKQVYSGQPEVECTGKYAGDSKQIIGVCSAGNLRVDFVAKKEGGWLAL
ncbi:MAG: hypothetical protein A2061_06800 [Gallionellales bacterium GWA2_59_43]|nr:MAG: hypothetical protein A2061_06800 [Gallionellales bacterium GWA2_59_43]